MRADVDDLLRKIHPIHPRFARRLWRAYLAGDLKDKDWVELAAKDFLSKTVGEDYRHQPLLLPPPPAQVALGEYRLGTVTYAGKDTNATFGLREEDWIQHVNILGRTGTGKTNLGSLILKQLAKHNKPFLVLDWKRNYRDLLHEIPGLTVLTAGRNIAPFKFNPWIPPPGTPIDVWTKKIIEVAVHAYFAGEGVIDVLLRALTEAYHAAGSHQGKGYPTTSQLIHIVRDTIRDTPRQAQWKASALRILRSIDFGPMGQVTQASHNNLDQILEQPVILELDALADADKTFLCESIMLWNLQYRLREQAREKCKHVLMIEEAHHLFLKRTHQDAEPITDIMLREIRELGVGVILLDQHPSLMTLPALGNPNTTVCFNLKAEDDVHAAAKSILLPRDQQDIIGKLPIGHAIVRIQARHPSPFTIHIPLTLTKKGHITDELLRPSKDVDVPRDVARLLEDIAHYPFATSTERYNRLGWHPRTAAEAVAHATRHELITEVLAQRRTGRVKLFDLTPPAKAFLASNGVPLWFPQHLEHSYWKHILQQAFERHGYTVKQESEVNGYADIAARKDNLAFAVEIETGKSDYVHNVAKCLASPDNFTKIVIAATNNTVRKRIARELAKRGLHTHPKVIITTTTKLDR